MSGDTHTMDLNIEVSQEKCENNENNENNEINKVQNDDQNKFALYCRQILQLLGSKDDIPCDKETQTIVVHEN
tara:strand:- start:5862 stop:6080 length:219 start_codon:yes stop_codon:yes gene_type:complete